MPRPLPKFPCCRNLLNYLLFLLCCPSMLSSAQSNALPSPAAAQTPRTLLHSSVFPLAQPTFDHGAVPDATPATRMLLLLDRSPKQDAALQLFLGSVQDKTSPAYHRFLAPSEFAAQYGPPDTAVESVTDWLQGQGFRVDKVSAGHQTIEFSGTAGQVRRAFRTELHRYMVAGAQHFANATPPAVPASLAPVIRGVLLGNFGAHPESHQRGTARLDRTSHRAIPLFNDPLQQNDCLSGYCFAVTPGDFAKIYNTAPLLARGIDGTGITIGVIGIAPIDLPSAAAYRQNFLPAYSASNLPVPVLEGPPPSLYGSGDVVEAQLDVEEAGGVAPNATVNFYYGASSYVTDGLTLGLIRAIDDNQASILSISYGGCEAYLGDTYNAFFNNLYQQAAAQGITVVAAAGDSGSATCDPPPGTFGATDAIGGLAVSGLASTPYNVAVGGTDFLYPAGATLDTLATYWNAASAAFPANNPDWSSAKGYIPEKPWNYSDKTLNQITSYQDLGAGGGGKSSCVHSSDTIRNVCQSGYPQPPWQVGVTQDSVRDLPDVSLFASPESNYSFSPFCLPGECSPTDGGPDSVSSPLVVAEIGGTSVSAPAFAGILALAEQKTGSRLGQVNTLLYALAAQQPSAFHDIAVGTNRVQCRAGTPDCGADGYLTGYSATGGYDLATGLGSVDAAVLVNNWNDIMQASTATTLTITPAAAVHGTTLTFIVNVTGGATAGSVALLTTANSSTPAGQYVISCAVFPCTFPYAGLPGGSYNIAARFAGDATHSASTSPDVPVTITPQGSELDIFAQFGFTYSDGQLGEVTKVNGQTLVFGGGVEFTTIPLPAGSPLPSNPLLLPTPATGNVSISDNGVALGAPKALNLQGNTSFQLFTLPVGQHALVVAYAGDASYAASTSLAPLATPLNFTIEKAPTTILLGPSAQAVTPGTPVALTATVSTFDPEAIDGSVVLQLASARGTATLSPAPLAFSTLYGAALATSTVPASALSLGVNTVTATYPGNSNLFASPVALASIDVEPANTSLTLQVTPAAPTAGQLINATATLAWPSLPNVSFLSGLVDVELDGAGGCSNDLAVTGGSIDTYCRITNIQPGTHTLTATYSGDSSYTRASASLTFTVGGGVPLSFDLSATLVTLAAKTISPSATSTVTLTLPAAATSDTAFTLACTPATGAPPTLSCSLPGTLTIPSGTAQATTTATVTLASTTAFIQPGPHADKSILALALLPAAWFWRRRRWSRVALLCLTFVATFGLGACGGNIGSVLGGGGGGASPPGSAPVPGTYALTVTAQSGNTTKTATILVRIP